MKSINPIKWLYLVLCFVISNGKAETQFQCPENVVDIDNGARITDLEAYCKKQPCIPKCCIRNEILIFDDENLELPFCGVPATPKLTTKLEQDKLISIYKTSSETVDNSTRITHIKSSKKFSDYQLVRNNLINTDCAEWFNVPFYIQENGNATHDLTDFPMGWLTRSPTDYCVDILYQKKGNTTKAMTIMRKEKGKYDYTTLFLFRGITSVISAFFLALVFAVYCILPQLRTMPGLLQMAYVSALFLTCITRACLDLVDTCSFVTTSLFYFGFLSAFFWLNTMSFDIWWTFRAQRYRRGVHRQGILAKFGWYSLSGWGIPLLMTIACIIIDVNQSTLSPTFPKPGFEDCLVGDGLLYYLIIPIGILIVINFLLFLMAIYNIWIMDKEINKVGRNTKNNNRIIIAIKLSIMMGTSWILELILKFFDEITLPDWLNMTFSSYNFLMGLVIFIIFVCNKPTLRMLCKRFNIECYFTRELNLKPSSRSTATKSSSQNGSYYPRSKSTADSDIDMEEMEEINPNPRNEK